MKNIKQKIQEEMCDKRCMRNKQIKIDRHNGGSKKAQAVTKNTCMCGTEPRVFRVASPGSGLPKWRKR